MIDDDNIPRNWQRRILTLEEDALTMRYVVGVALAAVAVTIFLVFAMTFTTADEAARIRDSTCAPVRPGVPLW